MAYDTIIDDEADLTPDQKEFIGVFNSKNDQIRP